MNIFESGFGLLQTFSLLTYFLNLFSWGAAPKLGYVRLSAFSF